MLIIVGSKKMIKTYTHYHKDLANEQRSQLKEQQAKDVVTRL